MLRQQSEIKAINLRKYGHEWSEITDFSHVTLTKFKFELNRENSGKRMKNVSQVKHRHTMKAGADLCLLSLMIEQFHLSALNKLTFDNTLASKTLLITVITERATSYATPPPHCPGEKSFYFLNSF